MHKIVGIPADRVGVRLEPVELGLRHLFDRNDPQPLPTALDLGGHTGLHHLVEQPKIFSLNFDAVIFMAPVIPRGAPVRESFTM
ncbi:MAG: hypothetical protein RL698_2485 [Pseudomonadota bacterium]